MDSLPDDEGIEHSRHKKLFESRMLKTRCCDLLNIHMVNKDFVGFAFDFKDFVSSLFFIDFFVFHIYQHFFLVCRNISVFDVDMPGLHHRYSIHTAHEKFKPKKDIAIVAPLVSIGNNKITACVDVERARCAIGIGRLRIQ